MYSDTKRCGSSNLVLGDRPGSPTLGLSGVSKTPYQRQKYKAASKYSPINEKNKSKFKSVLDNVDSTKVKIFSANPG